MFRVFEVRNAENVKSMFLCRLHLVNLLDHEQGIYVPLLSQPDVQRTAMPVMYRAKSTRSILGFVQCVNPHMHELAFSSAAYLQMGFSYTFMVYGADVVQLNTDLTLSTGQKSCQLSVKSLVSAYGGAVNLQLLTATYEQLI